jgi:hypothetical protein
MSLRAMVLSLGCWLSVPLVSWTVLWVAVLQVPAMVPDTLACVVFAALGSVLECRLVVALASAFWSSWVGLGMFVSVSWWSFEDCVAP